MGQFWSASCATISSMHFLSRALLIALFAPVGFASPVTYNIDFTLYPFLEGQPNFDILPTAGSLTFDAANPTTPFSDFTVLWHGGSFDLTAVANTLSAPGFGCDSETAAPNLGANIMFQTFTSPCVNVSYVWSGVYNPAVESQFAFIAESSVAQVQVDSVAVIGAGGNYQSGQGTWTLSPAVPEPASIGQLAVGLVGFACLCGGLSLNRARRRYSTDKS